MLDRPILERVVRLICAAACFAPCASATTVGASGTEAPLERMYRLRYTGGDSPSELLPTSGSPAAPVSSTSLHDVVDAAAARGIAGLEATPPEARARPADPEIPIHPSLTDRFFFGAGVFLASSTTEARLNSPSGIGTTVGFEDLLGLDNTVTTPQGLARWRMSERWRLELEYFGLNRSNSRALTQDIIWGDQTFPSGTTVDAKFDVSVTRVSAGYSFFKRPDKELGVALGFHVTNIKAELAGSGGGNADTGKVLAPLPVGSMYGQFALTDKWAIASRLDAFKLGIDSFRGQIFSMGVDLLYQPWRHFGMGIGWRTLNIQASVAKNDWEGAFRSNFTGPIAFISTSF